MAVAAVLYALALGVLLVFGLNQLWMAYRFALSDRLQPGPLLAPDARPSPPAAWPAVTVQLPIYNERFVAARLIDACAALDYPAGRLELQVLDDSIDETAEVVAERVAHWRRRGVDAVHVRRADRDGYKAGALANGLTFARGDLLAVFDADFVPPPDFLRRIVPLFDAPDVGLVQARWEHRNAGASVLTRVQAALLDAHFVIEQGVRQEAGCFMSFNGTAGVWRRSCIEDAGGWRADTLTEDLDLSYRAQLAGWRFRFVPGLGVPADLPASAAAWRQQQFRWTKGTAETARLLLRRLWAAPLPLRTRLQGALHLTGFLVYPAILTAALLHAPLLTAHALGFGVSDAYLAALGLGLFAFAGMALAHGFAQRALHPDWALRMRRFPWVLAASMGLAASNTRAAAEAFLGRRSPFVRTPKGYVLAAGVPLAEAALAAYGVLGLVVLVAVGAWAAVPFQALFAVGFGLVSLHDSAPGRLARPIRRTFPATPRPVPLAPSSPP